MKTNAARRTFLGALAALLPTAWFVGKGVAADPSPSDWKSLARRFDAAKSHFRNQLRPGIITACPTQTKLWSGRVFDAELEARPVPKWWEIDFARLGCLVRVYDSDFGMFHMPSLKSAVVREEHGQRVGRFVFEAVPVTGAEKVEATISFMHFGKTVAPFDLIYYPAAGQTTWEPKFSLSEPIC